MKYQYHYQNAIKNFTIPDQYNKDNAYWTDLFTLVKSWIRKIWMDMIYLSIFKLWGYIYFQNTNSLLLFGDIDLELMKDQTLLIKIFKLIHTRSPESCKIIQQVSVQTLVCVWINITSCKIKVVHFKGSDIDIKVHCTLFPLCSVFVPLGFSDLRFLTRQ